MRSKAIGPILRMAELYQKRPSEFLHLTDGYTAYCFDEACSYILLMERNGKVARYRVEEVGFAQFYGRLGVSQ